VPIMLPVMMPMPSDRKAHIWPWNSMVSDKKPAGGESDATWGELLAVASDCVASSFQPAQPASQPASPPGIEKSSRRAMESRVPVQSSRSMYLCGAQQIVGEINREPSPAAQPAVGQ
jgi:hypothetical protein